MNINCILDKVGSVVSDTICFLKHWTAINIVNFTTRSVYAARHVWAVPEHYENGTFWADHGMVTLAFLHYYV